MKDKLIVCFILLILISCNEKEPSNSSDTLSRVGDNIVREIYFDTGNTKKVVKYYSIDTIAHGSETHFDFRNKISKWLWWDKRYRHAQYVVYFDSNEVYDHQKGMPFLNAINVGVNTLAIEVVNPPIINFLVGYRDFKDDNIVRKLLKEPGKTDSTSWITISNHAFEKGHKYFVYFYIVDNKGNRIDSTSQELVL